MRTFTIEINEKFFNLLWRSLHARETELLRQIADKGEDSDDAALAGNDVVYLRLCKDELEEWAKAAVFSDGVFSLDEGFIDLADLGRRNP